MARMNVSMNTEAVANTFGGSMKLSLEDALYELIDNSVGEKGNATEVQVNFHVVNSHARKLVQIEVNDNGDGIPLDVLQDALGIGTTKGKEANEHGAGMKLAIAYLGGPGGDIANGLDSIDTCDGSDKYMVSDWQGNTVEVVGMTPTPQSGTNICVNVGHDIHMSQKISKLAEKIAVRYSPKIAQGLTLTINEVDEATGATLGGYPMVLAETTPPYYNRKTKASGHLIREDIVLPSVSATLTLGTSDPDHKGHWVAKNNKGGIDIVQHDIVVATRSWLPLTSWREAVHPTYNALIGRLEITRGHLETTAKKGDFEESVALSELREKIAEIILSDSHFKHHFEKEEDENDYSEAQIRDALKEYLETLDDGLGNKIWSSVTTEESTDTNLNMDVVATHASTGVKHIIEAKKNGVPFSAQHMNQLVGYMVAEGVSNGIVYAEKVQDDAKKQLDHWNATLSAPITIQYWDNASQKALRARVEALI